MNENKQLIYNLVSMVPKGKVTTYGLIAKKLKISPRLVGRVMHENKDPEKIPCHRVVFSDGSLSKNYAFGGEKKQKEKLVKEGILFNNDLVKLKDYKFIPIKIK